ncbi:hypothetical protein [Hyphomicrobium sp.]|uniref:hypothetical protein n=1 Tax=Hyphomicrobium sp. TaxID=82 RepID=UPI003F71B996
MIYTAHIAQQDNKEELKRLFNRFTIETGCATLYDDDHCAAHVQKLIDAGVSFLLRKNGQAIGMVTCHAIDAGYALLADLETTHTYVIAEERSYVAISTLLKCVEEHAENKGVAVLFSQCDYRSAVLGNPGNSERVQKLYKLRGYRGPIGVIYAAAQSVPVGSTFLFNGITADDIAHMPEVRRIPTRRLKSIPRAS